MQTLRVINQANKNVGYRTIAEIERALDAIRAELPDSDGLLTKITASLEVAAVEIKIGGRSVSAPKGNLKSVRGSSTPSVLDGPSARTLALHTGLMRDLDAKIKTLDSILAQLSYQFKGERTHDRMLAETKKLRAQVEDRIKKSYSAINTVAKGRMTTPFKRFTKEVGDALLEELDGHYAKSTTRLFIDTSGDNLRFTYYLRLENFVDEAGYTYKDYWICMTHVLGDNTDQYYVNTTPTFRVPGQFNMGQNVENSEDAIAVLSNILRSEGFKHIISADSPIPLGEDDVDVSKFSDVATKVSFSTQTIDFTLKAGVNKDSATNQLFLLVKGLVADKLQAKFQIKYQLKGNVIRFYLGNNQPLKLNRAKLGVLKQELGLSDGDIRKIQQEVL